MRLLFLVVFLAFACGGNTEDSVNSTLAGSTSVGGTAAGLGGRGLGGTACGTACASGSGGSSLGAGASGGTGATGGGSAPCGGTPSCSNLSCPGVLIPFCNRDTNSCECGESCSANPIACGIIEHCPSVCDSSGVCVCMGTCMTEGQIGLFGGCCSGLTQVLYYPLVATCADPSGAASYVCTVCGDNTCGLGENHCNCPHDCQ